MEEILIVLVCLILNALFACFEMAFVTVGKPQLRQMSAQGNRAATHVLKLRQNPERTLSVVQVGITLVGIISAAAGGAGAEESFSPYIQQRFLVSESAAEALALMSIVLPLTFLNVIFGELVPKAIALRNPILISTWGIFAIAWIDRALRPVIFILEKMTKGVLALLPRSQASANVDHLGSVDIDHLSRQTQQYVLNLVGIENRRVSDVMVAWDKVDRIEMQSRRDEVTQIAIRSGHTRLPVVVDSKVLGMLHTKEFIAMLAGGVEQWHSIVRPIIEVHSSSSALRALRLMQEKRSQMAVVIDNGLPAGIVTFEDILEEIVGEIYDEDDDGRVRKLMTSGSQRRLRS